MKKFCDYKFWYIRRDDNGYIIDVGIRFYEGKYKNVKIEDLEGKKKMVNRYIRTKKLNKNNLANLNTKFIKDASNNDAVFYNQEEFGQIKTDDELREFLNKQLAKVKGREAIAEQKWQR